jgi:site-specific DNA-methyltransferase (adenine-specific)
MERATVRLAFADPPYNMGVDYGDGFDDARPDDAYLAWSLEWMRQVRGVLTPDGSLWLLIPHEWAARLEIAAVGLGFHIHQRIVWYESFGVNCTTKFNRCSRMLLWFTNHKSERVFNPDAVRRRSDRQELYNDKRANPAGKLWDDVWGVNPPIPRLTGTCAERVKGFPTQLPLRLLRPIVGCASDPGDLVVDPFSGSGTTGVACHELNRNFIGIDRSARFCRLADSRLSSLTPMLF